mgnify:FL=1
MTTLFDVLHFVAMRLKPNKTTVVSNGNSGPTNSYCFLYELDEPANFYSGGTLLFLSGALAGKSVKINYQNGDGRIEFYPQTSAPNINDQVLVLHSKYPREDIIEAVNASLFEIGDVTLRDESLLTVAGQNEYTVPAGIRNIKRVQVKLNDDIWSDAIENWDWLEWENKLVFSDYYTFTQSNYPIRIWYNDRHPRVSNDNDRISDNVQLEVIGWETIRHVFMRIANIATNTSADVKEFLVYVSQQAEIAKRKYPVRAMARDPKLMIWE